MSKIDQDIITTFEESIFSLEHLLEACECEHIDSQSEIVKGRIDRAKAALRMYKMGIE